MNTGTFGGTCVKDRIIDAGFGMGLEQSPVMVSTKADELIDSLTRSPLEEYLIAYYVYINVM